MEITLTRDKVRKITNCNLWVTCITLIHKVAQAIGYTVSSLPAVKYGKYHYRVIEYAKYLPKKRQKETLIQPCFYHLQQLQS